MELGNLLFGNSRGIYPLNREEFQPVFYDFCEKAGINCYGFIESNSSLAKASEELINEQLCINTPIFTIRPYYWGDNEEIMDLSNFVYKPENIEISWYKYMLRDAYCNIEISPEKLKKILEICLKSLER